MERQEGGFSVLSKKISGVPEQQNQAMTCSKGLPWATEAAQCPRPGCSIDQLHTEQPQRRESSPHARTSTSSCFKRHTRYTRNYERTWYRKLVSFFFPLSSSSFHMKTGLSCMWVNLLLFILHQKSKLSKHHHTVCCHGNDHYATNRCQSSREETAGVNES